MRVFSRRAIPSLAFAAMLPGLAAAQTFFIRGGNPAFDPYADVPCTLGDGFVARAAGDVTETMLAAAPLDSLGRRMVSLMWYPVSRDGRRAGSGAYIARGTLAISPSLRSGPQGERISVLGRATNISVKVGYLRR